MAEAALPAGRAGPLAVPRAAVLPLAVRGLVFEAGGRRLIDGLDLTLEAGSRTAIMGPNGAGKTLLLRLLNGLVRPTSGSILWAGGAARRATRMSTAMVFQRPVVLRRSAAANIRYALRAHGVRGKALRSRLKHWLEEAGLTELGRRPARVLSGGEQQRLALARALSCEPQVLFLDEPAASLDPASVLAIEHLIQVAHEAGTKVVLVTHDLGQAHRIADEVVFIYRGRVEEVSPAATFFERPVSPKAQAFIEGRIVL